MDYIQKISNKNNLSEQLVTFATAKLAKEKGFNINTYFYYDGDGENYKNAILLYNKVLKTDGIEKCSRYFWNNFPLEFASVNNDGAIYGYNGKDEDRIMFPTQSLLQKWLKEKHNVYIHLDYNFTTNEYCSMACFSARDRIEFELKCLNEEVELYDNYEVALEQAIVDALNMITYEDN